MLPGRPLLAGLLLLICSACATQGVDKIAVTPSSEKAAVMVRAPSLPTTYSLGISAFDPENYALETNSFSGGWADLDIYGGRGGYDFYGKMIEPGTYVVRSVSQQHNWSTCFQNGTVMFSAEPGEIVYLGTFNGLKAVLELQSHARANPYSMNNESFYYMDGISPPEFAVPDEAEVETLRAFIETNMPLSSAAATVATLTTTKFGTGTSLFGGQRVCGGYGREGAEEQLRGASEQ